MKNSMYLLTLLVLTSISFLQAQDFAAVSSIKETVVVKKSENVKPTIVSTPMISSSQLYHSVVSHDPNEKLSFNLDLRNDLNVLIQVIDNYNNIVYQGSIHNKSTFDYSANLLLPGVILLMLVIVNSL